MKKIGTRTFDILSKYFAQDSGLKVRFTDEVETPQVNVKTLEMRIPMRIKEENLLPALGVVLHEAGHVRHKSSLIPKALLRDHVDHLILNAAEDVRIDRENQTINTNVRIFQEAHLEKTRQVLTEKARNGMVDKKNLRLLCGLLVNYGHFKGELPDLIPADEKERIYRVSAALESMTKSLGNGIKCSKKGAWQNVMRRLAELRELLELPREELKPKDKSQPEPNAPSSQQPSSPSAGGTQPANANEFAQEHNTITNEIASQVWQEGNVKVGGSLSPQEVLGDTALLEQTRKVFKEFLKVKEKRVTDNGQILDTGNLIAFFTGDIESLFKEDATVRTVNSKILFLLDASGSMRDTISGLRPRSPGYDPKQSRSNVLRSVLRGLVDILEETKNEEGIGIDWDFAGFDEVYHRYTKNSWEHEYRDIGTHTDILRGFTYALRQLKNDMSAQAKKIIIIITDGRVHPKDIDLLKRLILENNTDVRTVIVGIGIDPLSDMALQVIGDRAIYTPDQADQVLLETLTDLLE